MMKKYGILIGALALSLCVGCAGKDNNPNNDHTEGPVVTVENTGTANDVLSEEDLTDGTEETISNETKSITDYIPEGMFFRDMIDMSNRKDTPTTELFKGYTLPITFESIDELSSEYWMFGEDEKWTTIDDCLVSEVGNEPHSSASETLFVTYDDDVMGFIGAIEFHSYEAFDGESSIRDRADAGYCEFLISSNIGPSNNGVYGVADCLGLEGIDINSPLYDLECIIAMIEQNGSPTGIHEYERQSDTSKMYSLVWEYDDYVLEFVITEHHYEDKESDFNIYEFKYYTAEAWAAFRKQMVGYTYAVESTYK